MAPKVSLLLVQIVTLDLNEVQSSKVSCQGHVVSHCPSWKEYPAFLGSWFFPQDMRPCLFFLNNLTVLY